MSAFTRHNSKASKLSGTEVLEIRRLYQLGTFSQGELSRQFQVSVVQIGRIVRGESWQQYQVPERLMSEGELKESAERMMARNSGIARLQETAQEQFGKVNDMLTEIGRSPLDE